MTSSNVFPSEAALAAAKVIKPSCIQLVRESMIVILAWGYFSRIISLVL